MDKERVAESIERPGAEERPKHEVKQPKRVHVNVVEGRAQSVVVEVKNDKEWYRAIVPTSVIDVNGTVAEDDLRAGRYGEDWASMVDAKDFPRRLAEQLHVQGIFSFAELRQRITCARAAIAASQGQILADLLRKGA